MAYGSFLAGIVGCAAPWGPADDYAGDCHAASMRGLHMVHSMRHTVQHFFMTTRLVSGRWKADRYPNVPRR